MTRKPKEIQERINRQNKQADVQQRGIIQITAMLEMAGKTFVASKVKADVDQPIAIQWTIQGCCNVLADLIAYSKSQGYIDNVQELTIACATQINEMAENILEDHAKPGKSNIEIPE